jgi:hypothetical protein
VWPAEADAPAIDEDFVELASLRKLKELWVESLKLTGASVDTLLCFKNLERLHLDTTEFTDDDAIRLANGLSLREFHLLSTKFSDPDRICKLINQPRLYSRTVWAQLGSYVTSTPPSRY